MKIYKIKVNGKSYRVELEAIEQVDTVPLEEKKKAETNKIVNTNGAKEVPSPIQGQVTNIKVKVGDKVQKGDVLLIIEAMKLENEVVSPFEGQVAQILVTKGQNVKAKEVIVTTDYAPLAAQDLVKPNEDVAAIYGVKLIRTINGVEEEIQPSDIKEGTKIIVSMDVPTELVGKTFRLLHIHTADDITEVTNYALTQDGKTLMVEVDRLSEFAFITASEGDNGFDYNTTPIWAVVLLIIFGILLLIGLFFLFILLKKRNDDDDDEEKKQPAKAMSVAFFLPLLVLANTLNGVVIAFIVVAVLTVIVWGADAFLFAKGKKKASKSPVIDEEKLIDTHEEEQPQTNNDIKQVVEVKPSLDEVESYEDEEEVITVKDEKGNIFQIRFVKSFTAKLIQASDETKKYYEELKNYVLSYKKTSSRISWQYDSINSGRNKVLKFSIRGKTLCVYYPLNADDYVETKFKVEKAESKKFEELPCLYRIKNDRRCEYAKDLIDTVMANLGLEKGEEQHEVYSNLPYEPNKPLIKRGLIKELKVQLDKPVEEEKEAPLALKETIAVASSLSSSSKWNKETIAKALKESHGDEVEINTRGNLTSTGLPLADTHYAVDKETRKCFIYVYETSGAPLLLVNADDKLIDEVKEKHNNVSRSAFPKSKDSWYSIPLDDSYSDKEVQVILDYAHALALGRNEQGLSIKDSLAMASASKGVHTFNKLGVVEYLSKYNEVETNNRKNFTSTGLPLADTHYVKGEDGKKSCFIYVYETSGAMMFLIKANDEFVEGYKGEHKNISRSAFPKSKDKWYTVVLDESYSDDDVKKLLDDLIALNK